jgi:hypothetical protein
MPPRRNRALVVVAALAASLVACGGAESAKAPAAMPAATTPAAGTASTENEPRTVQEAQERIARARQALEPDQGAPPAPAKAPRETRQEESKGDACGEPCRALDSMRRAVEALCRMTGDGDPRCLDARKTLSESTSRLATCKCEPR